MLPKARACWRLVLEVLSWRCRTASALPGAGGPPGATPLARGLALAAALMRLPAVRDTWVSLHGWRAAFEGFLNIKPPTAGDLAAAVPAVAWPEAAEKLGMPGLDPARYEEAAGRLRAAYEAVSELQAELFRLLAATPLSITCALL